MADNILNLEQAVEFLGVSEKTLIKLLREEHLPARKIGREWRFSRDALMRWLAEGDSMSYISPNDRYMVSEDTSGTTASLMEKVNEALASMSRSGNNIKALLPELDRDVAIPAEAALRISYKQQRDVEKLEFKIFWELREDFRLETNQKAKSF